MFDKIETMTPIDRFGRWLVKTSKRFLIEIWTSGIRDFDCFLTFYGLIKGFPEPLDELSSFSSTQQNSKCVHLNHYKTLHYLMSLIINKGVLLTFLFIRDILNFLCLGLIFSILPFLPLSYGATVATTSPLILTFGLLYSLPRTVRFSMWWSCLMGGISVMITNIPKISLAPMCHPVC